MNDIQTDCMVDFKGYWNMRIRWPMLTYVTERCLRCLDNGERMHIAVTFQTVLVNYMVPISVVL
jgi:hypothetical protein